MQGEGTPAAALTAAELAAAHATAAEQGAPMVVVQPDPAGRADPRLLWANAAAATLLGLGEPAAPEPATIGALAGGLAQPTNWTRLVARLAASGELDEQWHTASLDLPGAPAAMVRVRVRPVGDTGRLLVWLRSADPDVIQAEEAADDAEFRFRAVGDNAPIGIVVSDVGVRLSFVNDAFARIVGVPAANLLGTGWLAVVDPEHVPGLLDTLEGVLRGTAAETAVRVFTTTGPQRWVTLRLAPVTTRLRSAGFVATVEDVTARRAWEAQLAYQASHDALTGLANRRHFVDAVAEVLRARRRGDQDTAVLFCDIDGFKQINDQLGHDAGDRVLIEIARRMTAAARQHDLVARIAGDEFVVMLRNVTDLAEAEAAAARHAAALTGPIELTSGTVAVAASIGVALASQHPNAAALIHAADMSMYRVKRGRGGSVAAAEGAA